MTDFYLYVDPGSGSYLIQIIIAAVVGAGFYVKTFWHRITSFFGRKKRDSIEDNDLHKPDQA